MGLPGLSLPGSVVDGLRDAVGPAHVLTDPDVTKGFSVDWTGRFRGHAAAVIRPETSAQVAAVVALCRHAGIAVVPQGGNTGLVGGGVPLHDELVLSLTRLTQLGDVDRASAQVTAGAGVVLASLQRHVGAHELTLGVDLAPRDSCTVGGMVATNAGGTNVIRHGTMRSQVMGVEAVLGTGEVVSHLGGLPKDNTGYDLAGLLTGSEGTLGIVTAARLRLVPRFSHRVTAALGFAGIAEAVEAVTVLRTGVPALDAAELVLAEGVELVASTLGLRPAPPLLAPAALIVEAAANVDPLDELASVVGRLDLVGEPVVATASEPRRRLWEIREAHSEAINHLGPPIKLDVSVPLVRVARFVEALPTRLPAGARLIVFGHLGDANLHVNVAGVLGAGDATDANADAAEAIERSVLEAVVAEGGSISAEHGIGTAKARYLHLNRSTAELDAFRRIKHALDPDGIMNPYTLLTPESG
jgi:FAD/FMN-containing dehydrogenase